MWPLYQYNLDVMKTLDLLFRSWTRAPRWPRKHTPCNTQTPFKTRPFSIRRAIRLEVTESYTIKISKPENCIFLSYIRHHYILSGQSTANSKIDVLAMHKPVHPGFKEDRRSVYWVDQEPHTSPTDFENSLNLHNFADISPRLEQLIKSKTIHKEFLPDRPSPIWNVNKSALTYPEKERLKQLAQHKKFHPDWQPEQSVHTSVSDSAQKFVSTKRLLDLSRPKQYDPLLVKSNSSWDWGEWKSDIPKESLSHVASGRLEQLAEPKETPKEYDDNRPVVWPVSDAAKNAQASTRQHQLARPKTRTALDQDHDPFKVSYAAKNAVASPRVCELCVPIPRKTRSKKA
ncbi:sperm microtubule associated protein 2-like [Clavelina lepadiformis]|uniref:sperm microtubule associated protein 2-like n=1 Tax=Clavelina lepadiformis TaxID=159417 RepID=UPI0040430C17